MTEMTAEVDETPKSVFNDREGIIRCANALAEIGEERIAALVRKIKAYEETDAAPQSHKNASP